MAFRCLILAPCLANEPNTDDWSGRELMREVVHRHEMYPYIYEVQTIVMMDRANHRDVRRARRYSRVETDGTVRFLLIFDSPEEVRGVTLLADRDCGGEDFSGIYMPAYGRFVETAGRTMGGVQFLGTDFTVDDLTVEDMEEFRYVRRADVELDGVGHFLLDVYPRSPEVERRTGYGLRRHFVRKDILFTVRTDYYDRRNRFFKTQTRHDLKPVVGEMWRANMVLMENHKEQHSTLIKINRRVFSNDYVPRKIFSPEWVVGGGPWIGSDCRLLQDALGVVLGDGVTRSGKTKEPAVRKDLLVGPRTGIPGDYRIVIPPSP